MVGRTWWAHVAFTRRNTTPTILLKKIEDLRETGARCVDRQFNTNGGGRSGSLTTGLDAVDREAD